jgi:aldose 1-epimerase
MPPSITRASYGTMPDGRPVDQFRLASGAGLEVELITYGGILTAIRMPDRRGRPANVTLGLGSLSDYLERNRFFGAITGRYANRLAGARFTLDGVEYRIRTRQGPNSLHGGIEGFDKKLWQAEPLEGADRVGVVLRYTSADGEEGYPGQLSTVVTYSVGTDNALRIDYEAVTDRPTVLNLTNHAYFNLAGEASGDVMGHEVVLAADGFTPTDAASIPTGEIAAVEGTPLDFRTPRRIGDRITEPHPQLVQALGYDHNFVLRKSAPGALELAARVREPESGRVLEVLTTEPGVQFYTGNYLTGEIVGSGGRTYRQSAGFCLETQHFPDSPNRPHFPSTTLRPGERFTSTTLLRFEVLA